MIVGSGRRCRDMTVGAVRRMTDMISAPLRCMRRISGYWRVRSSIRGVMIRIRLAGIIVMGHGRCMIVSSAGILTTATSRAL